MFDNGLKFNTAQGEDLTIITKCKLLFANTPCTLRSVELFFDDILADLPFRLVRCDRLSLFDTRLLPILRLTGTGADVHAVIVYSFKDELCRFICSDEYSTAAYAAPVLALFYKGEINAGQAITVISPEAQIIVTVSEDGAVLF